ncbi:MAG: hypothetical protein U9R58_15860 [Chloroflexota bacterium]|nr:hypothetical protein [Chloroflexota bacterium]
MSKKPLLIILSVMMITALILVGCSCGSSSGGSGGETAPGEPSGGADPSISIKSVNPGESVTIEWVNFPTDTELTAKINYVGTEGVNGTVVGTVNSSSTGSGEATFNIPAELAGESQLVIRLEGGAGYWAYHTFINN